jgi:nucleoside permease NupC
MKLHLYVAKSKVLQSSSSLVLDKILIPEDEHENEDEYEKYQIRSPETALFETIKSLMD